MSNVLLPNSQTPQASAPITDLAIEDIRRLLKAWNATQSPFPKNIGIHGLVQRQVARLGSKVAFTTDGESLTYAELEARSNRLARYLQAQGVSPGVCVAFCPDRSLHLIVGLLGILKAGGAYVPLDPAFPRDRIKYMLQDSNAPLIVTISTLLETLPPHDARVICLDSQSGAIDACSPEPLPHSTEDQDLAYVIYTSGSTGKPKGVEVTHGSVVNFLTSVNKRLGITERDVFLSFTTLSFDICGFDIFAPLSAGGKIVLVDRETALSGVRLGEQLENSGATVLQATPPTWRLLLDAGWREKPSIAFADAGPADIKYHPLMGVIGGETVPRELANILMARGVDLWNLYGPTETTICSTFHHVVETEGLVPIGKPLDNNTVYLLDERLEPVPVGEPGEIYIGGAGVARGYRNRPDLTAERFLHDPFSGQPGDRIYRTGDFARFRPDGVLEFLGRADHQVKIRGFRIELQEIESNLLRIRGVKCAIVVAQDGPEGAKRLVAFITCDAVRNISPDTLRSALGEALPRYMIPAQYVILPSLPLTLNGKVDRKALPLPAWGTVGSAYTAATDQTQRDLVEIFQGVLKTPRVGINDDFFELGGDSLTAASLTIQIRRKFDRSISLAGLFEAPTPAQLAIALDGEPHGLAPRMMALRQTGRKPPLFCLPGVGGSSLKFRHLVPYLPNDRPVYGYNIPPLDQRLTPLNTIRDFAMDVLRQIREVCPDGPFHLLGYSFGGSVAFEIAHLLSEQNQPIAFVGLIDTWAPGFPVRPSRFKRIALHAKKLLEAKPRAQVQYLFARLKNLRDRTIRDIRRLTSPPALRQPTQTSAERAVEDLIEAAEMTLDRYVPLFLNHRVDLFRVDHHPEDWIGCSFEDPYNGWRPFVGGQLNLTRLPCDHGEVFEESRIKPFASALIASLQLADDQLGERLISSPRQI